MEEFSKESSPDFSYEPYLFRLEREKHEKKWKGAKLVKTEANSEIRTRKLVNVFKNSMVVFVDAELIIEKEHYILSDGEVNYKELSRKWKIAVRCQNFFTKKIFEIGTHIECIEEHGELQGSGLYLSSGSSPDGKMIQILLNRGEDTSSNEQFNALLYSVQVLAESVVNVDKKTLNIVRAGFYLDKLCGRLDVITPLQDSLRMLYISREFPIVDSDDFCDVVKFYKVTERLLCFGIYYNSFWRNSYLRIYDANDFKKLSQPCLTEIKIDGAVHAVAISPNRKFLVMSITRGEFFYNKRDWGSPRSIYRNGRNMVVNHCVGPIEIWALGEKNQLIRKIKSEFEGYKKEWDSDNLEHTAFKSMAISNDGNFACVIGSAVCYYSFSKNKLFSNPNALNISFAKNDGFNEWGFNPGCFVVNDRIFLFRANSDSWGVFEIDEAAPLGGLLNIFNVDGINSDNQNETKKPLKSSKPVSGEKIPQSRDWHDDMELISFTMGNVPAEEEAALDSFLPPMPFLNSGVPESRPVLPKEPKLISMDEIKCEKLLTETLANKIHLATYQRMTVVFKEIKVAGGSEKNKSRIENEFNTLKTLRRINCPRIIEMHGYIFENDNYGLVFRFYEKGDLGHYVYHQTEGRKLKPWLYRCVVDVCEALDFLHKIGVIHKDIKPENVFLDENWHAVVGDFGTAVMLAPNQVHQSTESGRDGTLAFQAPELRRPLSEEENYRYTSACDVFSLSMLIWCCEAGKAPYEAYKTNHALHVHLYEVSKGKDIDREIIPSHTSPRIAQLIRGCWSEDPGKRLKISQVLPEMKAIYEEEKRNNLGVVDPPRSIRK